MSSRLNKLASCLVAILLALSVLPATSAAQNSKKNKKSESGRATTPVLWRDPGNIAARNLFYGPGSPARAPRAPFTFVEEDKGGESPKFIVRDGAGKLWGVKLGPEAQAETVATRLVWAVGYFAEEAYYFDNIRVNRLPKLSRGGEFTSGDTVLGVRFEPKQEKGTRGPTWDWSKNPFEETRELSGLKVLMILLNNYDARTQNNRVLYANSQRGVREARYYVTDLGATLGRAGGLGGKRAKNDLDAFLSTKFVRGIEESDGSVEFDYDTRPSRLGHLSVLHPTYYRSQVKKEKAMRGIPVEHAAWIGSYLSQLSERQLHDAFRAAGYDAQTAEGYVGALLDRINQLTRLPSSSGDVVGERVGFESSTPPVQTNIAEEHRAEFTSFEERIRAYVRMREDLEDRMPKLSKEASAEQIEAHKVKFQEAVRAARAGAQRGDLFTPEAAELIRAVIRDEFKGRDRQELRESVFGAENEGVVLRVNYPYPDTEELLEMPPMLLLRLPQLPKQVRYRFVGDNLLLEDRENRLILDIMPGVLP